MGQINSNDPSANPLDLRSDDVQDILSYIPHWIIRWGNTAILTALACIVISSWFIHYPEVVKAKIELTSNRPSNRLVTKSSGSLALLVADGELVRQDQYLAVIQNPAVLKDVISLRSTLKAFQIDLFRPENWLNYKVPANLELGSLQSDFAVFLQSLLDYQYFIESRYHQDKIESLKRQIQQHQLLSSKLAEQKEVLSRELDFAEKEYAANKELFARRVIAQSNLTAVESRALDKRYALVEEEKRLISNQIELEGFQSNVLELQREEQEKSRELVLAVRKSFDALLSALTKWEQEYVFVAPMEGKASFSKFWSDKQFVNQGDEVLAVVPVSEQVVGRIQLPQAGAGRVASEQVVWVKLDSFPSSEFGSIKGQVKSISQIAHGENYLVEVTLANGLKTTYGKELPFKDGMQGSAEIVANDLRLIVRIFNQFRFLFGK